MGKLELWQQELDSKWIVVEDNFARGDSASGYGRELEFSQHEESLDNKSSGLQGEAEQFEAKIAR